MATFVRRDIWNLEDEGGPWHPVIDAFAGAVGVMKQRSLADSSDPTGWAYQASVHAVRAGAPVDAFQHQCQHGSWFFLPWHRIYLHWFEEILRTIIRTQLPGVSQQVRETWALPYWDYSRGRQDDQWRTLPHALRTATRPDGSPNPLFTSRRNTTPGLEMNAGKPLDDLFVSTRALDEQRFSRSPIPGGTNGFGGPVTGWHHDPGPAGRLEITPHGDVHTNVGGPGGLMTAFASAPLDPAFWLHHANIDRLWVVWRHQDDVPRRDPTDPGWLNFPFPFRDATGTPVNPRWTPRRVLDTVADLGYTYENVDRFPARAERLPRMPEAPPPPQPGPDHPPELVGASTAAVQLSGDRAAVAVDVGEAAGPARRGGPGDADQQVFLQIDDVRGTENPGVTYAVYVNLPDGADPDDDPDSHYVGNVSLFGIEATNDLSRDVHGSNGLSFAFEITDLARTQQDAWRWDPSRLTVTFVPIRGRTHRGVPMPEVPAVSVGRIGVYVR